VKGVKKMDTFVLNYCNDKFEYIYDSKNERFVDVDRLDLMDIKEDQLFLSELSFKNILNEFDRKEEVFKGWLNKSGIEINGIFTFKQVSIGYGGKYIYEKITTRKLKEAKKMTDLEKNLDAIAKELETFINCDYCDEENREYCDQCEGTGTLTAMSYVFSSLDVEHITSDNKYIGSRLLVAFGGPSITIDFSNNTIIGYWWGEKAVKLFDDTEFVLEIKEALSELYNIDC
jgi:hypothetical protein